MPSEKRYKMVEECCLAKERPRTTESNTQETFGAITAMYISDLVQMQHHCEDTTYQPSRRITPLYAHLSKVTSTCWLKLRARYFDCLMNMEYSISSNIDDHINIASMVEISKPVMIDQQCRIAAQGKIKEVKELMILEQVSCNDLDGIVGFCSRRFHADECSIKKTSHLCVSYSIGTSHFEMSVQYDCLRMLFMH